MEETHRTRYVYEGEAADLLREMRKLNDRFDDLEEKAEDAGDEIERTGKRGTTAAARLRRVGRDLRTTSQGFAVMSTSAGRGVKLLGALTTGIAAAGGAAGVAGFAAVGFGVAIAGVTAAAATAGQAMITLAGNAREMRAEAQAFPGFISQQEVNRLVETDDALEGARLALSGLAVTVTTQFAPAIERGAVLVTAMVLAVQDVPERAFVAVQALNALGLAATGNFGAALGAAGAAMEAYRLLADETVDYVQKAEMMFKGLGDIKFGHDEAAAAARDQAAATRDLGAEFEAMLAATDRANSILLAARGDTLSQEEQLREEYARQINELNNLAEANANAGVVAEARLELELRLNRDLVGIEEKRLQLAEEARRKQEEAISGGASYYNQLIQTSESLNEGRKTLKEGLDFIDADVEKRVEAYRALNLAASVAISQSVATGLGALSDLTATAAAQGGSAARTLAGISKAAGLAQATVSTYVGAAKALELGPILGPPAAAAQIAAGLAQVASIAAVSVPTGGSDHMGSSGARIGLAPDEYTGRDGRTKLRSELDTPSGTVNSTGAAMVDDLNNGRLGGGGGPIRAVIGRDHVDLELFKSSRRGTSRFARLLRTNPHPKPNKGY